MVTESLTTKPKLEGSNERQEKTVRLYNVDVLFFTKEQEWYHEIGWCDLDLALAHATNNDYDHLISTIIDGLLWGLTHNVIQINELESVINALTPTYYPYQDSYGEWQVKEKGTGPYLYEIEEPWLTVKIALMYCQIGETANMYSYDPLLRLVPLRTRFDLPLEKIEKADIPIQILKDYVVKLAQSYWSYSSIFRPFETKRFLGVAELLFPTCYRMIELSDPRWFESESNASLVKSAMLFITYPHLRHKAFTDKTGSKFCEWILSLLSTPKDVDAVSQLSSSELVVMEYKDDPLLRPHLSLALSEYEYRGHISNPPLGDPFAACKHLIDSIKHLGSFRNWHPEDSRLELIGGVKGDKLSHYCSDLSESIIFATKRIARIRSLWETLPDEIFVAFALKTDNLIDNLLDCLVKTPPIHTLYEAILFLSNISPEVLLDKKQI